MKLYVKDICLVPFVARKVQVNHEGLVKSVRTYAISIHGVNIIVHKLPGNNPRERAAMPREFKKALGEWKVALCEAVIQTWLGEAFSL